MSDEEAKDAEERNKTQKPNRRTFLRWGLRSTVAGVAGLGGYTWWLEPHWIQVVRREMPVRHLPEALECLTLAHISDLHVGPVVDRDYLIKALKRVNSLEPDFVVITGDFMTCEGQEELDELQAILENLKPGKLASLAVLGNHDYGESYLRDDVADALTRRLPQLGIRPLRNEVATVEGLHIAGIDDYWGTNFFPEDVLGTLDHERANLVLCHNPDVADLDVWSDYQGWILSGHTHGGQCRFPLVGAPILPVKNKRYVVGEIALADGRKLYINPGLGYLQRVRFCVPPEITIFTLRRSEPNT